MQKHLVEALQGIVGPDFVLADGEENRYTTVIPGSTEEVSKVLALANAENIPVCPAGAGDSASTAAAPPHDGIRLLTTRLNKIVEIDIANLIAIVEPGIMIADLNSALKKHGLFYPPEPGLFPAATLGGMAAKNTAGMRDLKYGSAKHFIMGFEAVLADGRVLKTGGKNVKDVAGYDLTKLITGSDGTLAVITKVTVKLMPVPETAKTIIAAYNNLSDAGQAVSALLAAKLTPTILDILDGAAAAALERQGPSGLPAGFGAVLLLEIDGIAEAVSKQAEKAIPILKTAAAQIIELDAPEERSRVWSSLQSTTTALANLGVQTTTLEFAVPAGKVAAMIQVTKEKAAAKNLSAACFGHAGAGNIYAAVGYSPNQPEQVSLLASLCEELAAAARRLGGTYVDNSFDSAIMNAVKKALDPKGILNPGKLGKGV